MTILLSIIQVLLLPALAPLPIGVIRKIKAKFQKRQGASIFQPYRDLWKLFHKDEVISRDASWVFRVTPVILFGVACVVAAAIPSITNVAFLSSIGDILVLVYLLAFATFFLALAGMDTGGAFGGFGSSREMTLAAVAEGGLVFALLTLALLTKTTDIFAISNGVTGILNTIALVPVLLAAVGFFIAMLAESARYPFDNPATHLELTMVHEAMILEYSGKRLALVEWASWTKQLILMTLIASTFLPWGIAADASVTGLATGLGAFLLKIFIISGLIAIIESSIAKLRFFRLPDLLFVSFILSAIAIILFN